VAVIVLVALLGLALVALVFGGTMLGQTKGGETTTNSSGSLSPGSGASPFYMAMNVIPSIRLIPLGGSSNFTIVLYNGGDLTGSYSLSAVGPAGLSFEFGAIPVAISGEGPHLGNMVVKSSNGITPGTYEVTVLATGPKGASNTTFDFHVQRNLILLHSSGKPVFVNLTVKAGDSVTWVSLDPPMSDEDNAYQQVIFLNMTLTSGSMLQYSSWSHTFSQPGNYRYYDYEDPTITGEIVVLP
jgi:plastocyanin